MLLNWHVGGYRSPESELSETDIRTLYSLNLRKPRKDELARRMAGRHGRPRVYGSCGMIVSMQDELIMAFADDELEAPLAACVQEAIRNDAEIRRKYDVFIGTRAVLTQAFDGITREPVPKRLEQTVTAHRTRRRVV